jgi:activator of 2-hydroxyglutaryl-CoA dehydratase
MESLSKRVAAMADRIGVDGLTVFSGGVAKNAAMVQILEKDLGVRLTVPEEPRITGALGAALIAVG